MCAASCLLRVMTLTALCFPRRLRATRRHELLPRCCIAQLCPCEAPAADACLRLRGPVLLLLVVSDSLQSSSPCRVLRASLHTSFTCGQPQETRSEEQTGSTTHALTRACADVAAHVSAPLPPACCFPSAHYVRQGVRGRCRARGGRGRRRHLFEDRSFAQGGRIRRKAEGGGGGSSSSVRGRGGDGSGVAAEEVSGARTLRSCTAALSCPVRLTDGAPLERCARLAPATAPALRPRRCEAEALTTFPFALGLDCRSSRLLRTRAGPARRQRPRSAFALDATCCSPCNHACYGLCVA